MTVPTLRDAEPADLDAIVRVFLECFRVTYAARLPSRLVRSMSDEEARTLWSRALTTPGREMVVAQVDDEVCGVVGFAADGEDGWVHSLYVAPDAQRRGVGGEPARPSVGARRFVLRCQVMRRDRAKCLLSCGPVRALCR